MSKMVESTTLRALQAVAKLSGSFAVSGLAAVCVAHGKTHQAYAWRDPIYLPYRAYPVKRPSGKIVQFRLDGSPDIVRPFIFLISLSRMYWVAEAITLHAHPNVCVWMRCDVFSLC